MLSELRFKSPNDYFWIRKTFLKQCKTRVSSSFRAKTLLCLTGNFSGMVFKTAFSLSERTFVGETELFRKDTSFDAHCRTLSWNLSDFWQKIFGRVVETAFFVSQWKFWSKNLSFKDETFYEYSQTLTKNVLAFGKKRSAWFSKQHSTCPGEHFEENGLFH